jgi:hypothetical protein
MDSQTFYRQTMYGIAFYLKQELDLVPNQNYAVRQTVDNPRTVAVELAINPRYRSAIISLREDLAMAAGLDEDQALRIVRGPSGTLILEIPKPAPLWFNIGVDSLPPGEGLKSAVGLDQKRRPTLINFANTVTPHVLIAGTTGSGKTNAEQLLVRNLAFYNAPDQVQLILVDVEKRGIRWSAFDRLAHLAHPVVVDGDEARQVMAWLVAEIDRRGRTKRTTPRLFLFVDELQALVRDEAAIAPLVRVAQMGREFGVHLVAALQNPTKENIGHIDIKRNLAVRLVGRVDDGNAAHVATGQKGSGAEQLTGAGDFLMVQPGQTLQRMTVALLSPADVAQLPQTHHAQVQQLPLEEVGDPERVLEVSRGPGRPEDDYDWPKIGHLVGELADRGEINPHRARRWFQIGLPKSNRFLTAAEGVLSGLRENGFEVVRLEGAQQ